MPDPPPDIGPGDGEYVSTIVELFEEELAAISDPMMLDVGPVCGENIAHFAGQVKQLHVCDLFLRMSRERKAGAKGDAVWRDLDYPEESFHGMVVWDLPDRLQDSKVMSLVDLSYRLLKPGGYLVVFAHEQSRPDHPVNTFVIGPGHHISRREQAHLNLPLQIRQNRELLAMFAPYEPIKSVIYRNGLREFLFRRPRGG